MRALAVRSCAADRQFMPLLRFLCAFEADFARLLCACRAMSCNVIFCDASILGALACFCGCDALLSSAVVCRCRCLRCGHLFLKCVALTVIGMRLHGATIGGACCSSRSACFDVTILLVCSVEA